MFGVKAYCHCVLDTAGGCTPLTHGQCTTDAISWPLPKTNNQHPNFEGTMTSSRNGWVSLKCSTNLGEEKNIVSGWDAQICLQCNYLPFTCVTTCFTRKVNGLRGFWCVKNVVTYFPWTFLK